MRHIVIFLTILGLLGCDITPDKEESAFWDTARNDSASSRDSAAEDSSSPGGSDSGNQTDPGGNPYNIGAPLAPMDCGDCDGVGGTVENMLCAFDICDDSIVSGNTITNLLPFHTATDTDDLVYTLEDVFEAVARFGDSTNELAPRRNGSYALFGTGKVGDFSDYNSAKMSVLPIPSPYQDANDNNYNMYDLFEWTIELTAPEDAAGFSFKYVFFSAEFDEFISSPFNDKFYVILNAPFTTGGRDVVINYTDCRDSENHVDFGGVGCDTPTGNCCYIAVNSSMSECCWYPSYSEHVGASDPNYGLSCPGSDPSENTDISGTGYECAVSQTLDYNQKGSSTGWLQTTWPIEPGEKFTLRFHIHDTSDRQFDSEVILDDFVFHAAAEAEDSEAFTGTIRID